MKKHLALTALSHPAPRTLEQLREEIVTPASAGLAAQIERKLDLVFWYPGGAQASRKDEAAPTAAGEGGKVQGQLLSGREGQRARFATNGSCVDAPLNELSRRLDLVHRSAQLG